MKPTEVAEKYLDCLRAGDLDGMDELFSEDALVHSPLYGEREARAFFRDLFSVTGRSEIELMDVFRHASRDDLVAARFRYRWTLSDGEVTDFECVDVFELELGERRAKWRLFGGGEDRGTVEIKRLTIIYDTRDARSKFERAAAVASKETP